MRQFYSSAPPLAPELCIATRPSDCAFDRLFHCAHHHQCMDFGWQLLPGSCNAKRIRAWTCSPKRSQLSVQRWQVARSCSFRSRNSALIQEYKDLTWSTLVSLEERYEMKPSFYCESVLITFPRALKEALIKRASSSRAPCEVVRLTLSLPAKSTNVSLLFIVP